MGAFNNFLVLTFTLLPVTNVSGDGDVLPLKLLGNILGFEVRNLYAEHNAQGIPQMLKFEFSTVCSYSTYFVNADALAQAQPQFLGAGIMPINNGPEVMFNGVIGPQRRLAGLESAAGVLCFKSIRIANDPVTRLLEQYQNKVVSIYLGGYYWAISQASTDDQTIGEIGIGTINERRIAEGPRAQFPLKSLEFNIDGMPRSWITQNPVPIRISNQLIAESPCEISFDYDLWITFVPKNIYNQIARRLTDGKKTALADSVPAVLHDMLPNIHEYANINLMRRFPCSDIDKLPDLHFGDLLIPGHFLYYRQNGKCFLSVRPEPGNQGQQCKIYARQSILSKYHVTVDFNDPGSEFIQFALMSQPGPRVMNNQAASSSSGSSSSGRNRSSK